MSVCRYLDQMKTRANKHSGATRGESGFTLVELLVVMLILGLLAAIAIPAFFNQREKADDAKAKETVSTARVAIEAYSVDHQGDYTGASEAALHQIEQTIPVDVPLTVSDTTRNSYTLTVTSSTGTDFVIAREPGGTMSFGCTVPSKGGCPADGTWD